MRSNLLQNAWSYEEVLSLVKLYYFRKVYQFELRQQNPSSVDSFSAKHQNDYSDDTHQKGSLKWKP